MTYCINCGRELREGISFCPECGQPVQTPLKTIEVQDTVGVQDYSPNMEMPFLQPDDQLPMTYGNMTPVTQYQTAPAVKLGTNRSMWKYILLSIPTFGIYSIIAKSRISRDINTIASKYDGRKTMHYCLVLFVFSWLTIGIFPIIWWTRLCSRIGNELKRRGIDYGFGAGTYWGWGFFGKLIIAGFFLFNHKLATAMNLLAEDYNKRG